MERISINKEITPELLKKIVKILESGGLIIYPTETCYGVGVDATNPDAVKRLLEYKSRPEGKPISIAVSDRNMADNFVHISKQAENIYKNLLPGPVTVVSKSKGQVDKRLESEEGKLGIRIPDHFVPLEILQAFKKPITSTSANESGKKTPYKIEDILENLMQKKIKLIDLILDLGELPENPPSTVVDTTLMELNIIRQGGIQFSQNVRKFESGSVLETMKIAAETLYPLLKSLREKTVVILLDGELGAGKTHFMKGVAKTLLIKDEITSPTYTYMHEFDFKRGKLIHFDLWKLESEKELDDLEFSGYLKAGNIVGVEWWSKFDKKILEILKEKTVIKVKVFIENVGADKRNLAIEIS